MTFKSLFAIASFASILLLRALTANAESPDTQDVISADEAGLPVNLQSALQRGFDEDTFGQRPNINYADDPKNREYEVQRCSNNWCLDTGSFSNQNQATQNNDSRLPRQAPSTLRLRQDFDINR
ncbi:MAG: hypothetical protein K8F25_00665 [Fimbriimonadaceae bacterium]|nr:hypothetical protein [Alphaproteobacteria bacterium]